MFNRRKRELPLVDQWFNHEEASLMQYRWRRFNIQDIFHFFKPSVSTEPSLFPSPSLLEPSKRNRSKAH
jgi:hypothetical protein